MIGIEKNFRLIIAGLGLLVIGLTGLIVTTVWFNRPVPLPTIPTILLPEVAQPNTAPTPPLSLPVSTATSTTVRPSPTPQSGESSFIIITGGCNFSYTGECIRVRSGPGLDFPVISSLRNDMLFKIDSEIKVEADGHTWYKIIFDEWIRYPDRLKGDWYIAADYVRLFTDEGIITSTTTLLGTTTKRIIVDRSTQTLTAYDGPTVFATMPISTGLDLTPTPRGTFTIYKKTPTRYMQGPLPGISSQYYDLPGVPWNLYFTEQGAVIHGAYWHNSFSKPYSHGCVNLSPENARTIYQWATVGTQVTVQD